MPAVSQQQQKIMGLALAYKRGDVPPNEVSSTIKKIANAMSEKELEKYAGTSHKNLPKKVDEKAIMNKITKEELSQMISDAVEEVMRERFSVKKLTPEQKQKYLDAISYYKIHDEIIYRSTKLKESVDLIKSLVEFASKNMIEESGDWFEGVSQTRNSKALKESIKVFEKTANKIIKMQQTLESIYEHIGRSLGKFYNIKNK